MDRESVAEDMEKAGFPVIESLSDRAYGVGEVPFSLEWFPEGRYKGVVKELISKMEGYNIELVYLPDVDTQKVLVHLQPIELPSGFAATVFPKNVKRFKGYDSYNLECGFETDARDRGNVFSFDSGGEYLGSWGSGQEERMRYIEGLKELFEAGNSDGTERRSVIDAIRLRKTVEDLSRADLEELQKMFKKHRFKGAVFETRSLIHRFNYIERISQLDVTSAYKEPDEGRNINGFRMGLSYRTNDKRYEGSPNSISILLYSGNDSILDSGDLRILEGFAGMF